MYSTIVYIKREYWLYRNLISGYWNRHRPLILIPCWQATNKVNNSVDRRLDNKKPIIITLNSNSLHIYDFFCQLQYSAAVPVFSHPVSRVENNGCDFLTEYQGHRPLILMPCWQATNRVYNHKTKV